MSRRLYRKWTVMVLTSSVGGLFAFGCVTDAQLRDFLSSTAIRTVFQTTASAIQAALISAFGSA